MSYSINNFPVQVITPSDLAQSVSPSGSDYLFSISGGSIKKTQIQNVVSAANSSNISQNVISDQGSSTKWPSVSAVYNFVANQILGLLKLSGGINCSANPNYPAAIAGQLFYSTGTGLIGGSSGKPASNGAAIVCIANSVGGDQATVGSDWIVLQQSLLGALLAGNNLSQITNQSTARSNLGLGTAATYASTDFATSSDITTALTHAPIIVNASRALANTDHECMLFVTGAYTLTCNSGLRSDFRCRVQNTTTNQCTFANGTGSFINSYGIATAKTAAVVGSTAFIEPAYAANSLMVCGDISA